jgi:MFS family permease
MTSHDCLNADCAPTGFFLSDKKSHGAHEPSSETQALVGFWTGNLVSVFFITQFFTSLLWSGIADKYGRRLVLVVSLLGSAISESVCETVAVRCDTNGNFTAVVTFGTSGSVSRLSFTSHDAWRVY